MEKTFTLESPTYDPGALAAPDEAAGVYLYKDAIVPFLRLKVTQRSRIWQFDWSLNGKHVKRKIGIIDVIGLPEARLKAYEWGRQLSEGIEPPTIEQRRNALAAAKVTVGELFEKYFEEHGKTCKTAAEIERGFNAYWNAIKDVPAVKLQAEQLQRWVNDLARTRGKATASKQFTILRATVRFAIERKLAAITEDCLRGIKTYKSEPSPNYLKPGDEFRRMEQALALESSEVRDAVLLMLWTAQRKSNVLSMEWKELDLTSRLWLIPPHKTKTGKLYTVALTPKAVEIIERRRLERLDGDEFVFPCVRNSNTRHLRNINKAWGRVRESAGLGKLRPHDLRHTAATWLAMAGANAFVIQEALQHASVTTSQRYVHRAPNMVRDQMARAQDAMLSIATGDAQPQPSS